MEAKLCRQCGDSKPLADFNLKTKNPDGRRSECRTCQRQYGAQRRSRPEVAERERQIARGWYHANKSKDKIRKSASPELQREYSKRWRQKNPEKLAAKKARRRTAQSSAGGSFTGAEFVQLKRNTGNVCLCCGVSGDDVTLAADHVIPVLLGGTSDISNIQPLCGPCNSSKGTKSTDYREV